MMKVAMIAMILILINIVIGVIASADIFGGGQTSFYEARYTERYTEMLDTDISSFSEEQQFSESMNIFDVLIGSMSFNWITQFVPTQPLKEAVQNTLVLGLNAFLGFLISVALVELYMKRANMLG